MPGRILIIALDGELTVKRLKWIDQSAYLVASNPRFPNIALGEQDCHVWGVVTHVIHALPGGARA